MRRVQRLRNYNEELLRLRNRRRYLLIRLRLEEMRREQRQYMRNR